MRVTSLQLRYEDLQERLLPLLRGRVFHVTCAANIPAIAAGDTILPNVDGQLSSAFGMSIRSFFRLRGCVSVFDYRQVNEEELQHSLGKCAPWQAGRHCGFELAIYFLASGACARLESSALRSAAQASEMVVPYVEAGHPGGIPLDSIDDLLRVAIDYVPHPLEVVLEKLGRRAPPGSLLPPVVTGGRQRTVDSMASKTPMAIAPDLTCPECSRVLPRFRSFMQGIGPGEPTTQLNTYTCTNLRCGRGWIAEHPTEALELFDTARLQDAAPTRKQILQAADQLSAAERHRLWRECDQHPPCEPLPLTSDTAEHYCERCFSLYTLAGALVNEPPDPARRSAR